MSDLDDARDILSLTDRGLDLVLRTVEAVGVLSPARRAARLRARALKLRGRARRARTIDRAARLLDRADALDLRADALAPR